jgi:hypothetical protein
VEGSLKIQKQLVVERVVLLRSIQRQGSDTVLDTDEQMLVRSYVDWRNSMLTMDALW